MRTRALLLALLALALPLAEGARTLAYPRASTLVPSLATFGELPLQLSAGPDGANVSATNTSSSASITAIAGGVLDATANNTVMKNPGASAVRARLVFQSAGANASRCLTCKLQIRIGATTSDQIVITNGVAPAAGSAGSFVTIPAGGVAAIWSDAKATLPTNAAVVAYWLEIVPASSTSPAVDYLLMTQTFVV